MAARRKVTRPSRRPAGKRVAAVFVVGTGFGGDVEGCAGPTELGKLGLNAGTSHFTGDFPQVAPRDFVAASSVRANFSRLVAAHLGSIDVRQIAALAGVDPLDAPQVTELQNSMERTIRDCATHSLAAVGNVLADTCFLLLDPDLHSGLGVNQLYLGGGVAQHGTREFLTRVFQRRGEKIGLRIEPNNGSFDLEVSEPLGLFREWLHDRIPEDRGPPQFLSAAFDHAYQYFAVCEGPYQTLRSYLPYFAVDEILRGLERRSGALAVLPVFAGQRQLFKTLLPTGVGFDPADKETIRCLQIVACSVFCKLLTKAVLEGYAGDSNFESETAVRQTLAGIGVLPWMQDLFASVYRAHGFATLIESYRRTVVALQAKWPPANLALLNGWHSVPDCDGLVLGLDIGAENVKVMTWQARAGRIERLAMAKPFETPRVLASEATGDAALHLFFRKLIDCAQKQIDLAQVGYIGVSWPGPVTQSGPAQFSSVLRLMPGLPTQVLGTLPEHLERLDIELALGSAWEQTFDPKELQITLLNDGTAFAAFYLRQDLVQSAEAVPVRYHGAAGAALMSLAPDFDSGSPRRAK